MYGPASEQYITYMNEDRDYRLFADHMLHGAEKLDSLYQTMDADDLFEEKLKRKRTLIRKIVNALDTLSLSTMSPKPSQRYQEHLPNNAYFMNFMRYQSKQDVFFREWKTAFDGDLQAYIEYLSGKYPFL